MNEDKQALLLSEMQQLADVIHRRAYSHVPQWRVLSDPRGVLSQIDNMVAGLIERVEKLRGAISWLEPPFVDEHTSNEELRMRVRFAVRDAQGIEAAIADETPESGSVHESPVAKPCAQ